MKNKGKWLRILLILFGCGIILTALLAGVLYWYSLKDYKPNIITQIYSDDGTLIGEYAEEQRKIVPLKNVPQHVIDAFVITEDARFYKHEGLDYVRIAGAFWSDIRAREMKEGASTITMQVARSFFLTKKKLISRKIKEAILAQRIERYLSKEDILFLYLNQIWLGRRSYGVQVAAENYFGKDISEVTLAEAAVLAALPRAPARYSPVTHPERCKVRQRYVLDRMVESGEISQEDADKAYEEPLRIVDLKSLNMEMAPYFTEHIRRYLVETYGDDVVMRDGLKVFTTVNLEMQKAAQKALREGLSGPEGLDKRQGFRGPIKNLSTREEQEKFIKDTGERLAREWLEGQENDSESGEALEMPDPVPLRVGEKYEALVTGVNDSGKTVYLQVGKNKGFMTLEDMKWARKPDPEVPPEWVRLKKPSQALEEGDVVLVRVKESSIKKDGITYRFALDQEPEAQAGLIAFSVRTGEVKAMVGGYDFYKSQLIRPVQSARQPGSSFKPINYGAALSHPVKDYTAGKVILDSPVVFDDMLPEDEEETEEDQDTSWRPSNYGETFSGPRTFHEALAKSINTISIKILDDIGVGYARKFARRLGITSPMPKDLSIALGSAPVTLVELCRAYNVFASGGYLVNPVYIRRIYDRDGNLLEYMEAQEIKDSLIEEREMDDEIQEDDLLNAAEEAVSLSGRLSEPVAPEEIGELGWEEYLEELRMDLIPSIAPAATPAHGPEVLDRQTAYLMTSLLKGVIQYGTGWKAKRLGWPLAGKTGTTNDFKDAWFIGFSPEIICGVWVGFDDFSRSLGRLETGSRAALPIWIEFMKEALAGKSPMDFPQPHGIEFANIDNETGLLAGPCSEDTSFLAFKEGTAPTETTPCSPARIHGDLLRSLDY
jgi:penicillin-binding protein 1A